MASEIRQWAEDVSAAGARVGPLVRMAVSKTAADIERTAKQNTPVRTGNLMNSIGHTVTNGSGYAEAEVGPTASYGIHVELGTSRQAPQPYLAPAHDLHAPKLQEALQTLIERSL